MIAGLWYELHWNSLTIGRWTHVFLEKNFSLDIFGGVALKFGC